MLVVVLDGWIDAGLGAAAALEALTPAMPLDTGRHVRHRHAARPPGPPPDHAHRRRHPDRAHLADHRAARPAPTPRATTCCSSSAPSPTTSWRAFSAAVVDLAVEIGCRMIVGLGAYPAPAPHTRPTRVVATTASPDLARAGRLHPRPHRRAVRRAGRHRGARPRRRACRRSGSGPRCPTTPRPCPTRPPAPPSSSRSTTSPACTSAPATWATRPASARIRLDGLIADSDEHQQLVRQLEDQVDAVASADGGGLPSGEELAAELERYLRDQDSP